jgi:hypothetical protein
VTVVLIKTISFTSPHAAAYSAARVAATGTWTGRAAVKAPVVGAFQGTTVSAARTRFGIAPTTVAQLPFSVLVMTDGNAGIRAWSPPV